ncbi:NINE protein [Galbitalea sp. SE-J8]|uniref:NINE protein n=1 Tax=Galbitalea sp. SE-J8 TaxID=3054952 RepID=UPI00259D0F5E|nr:NINE protein [Galbitalea sp. SE-J8]MDM4761812.1 NINE protein [Galbitalea sp. SE-J8]
MTIPSGPHPAGWYRDPANPAVEHYWDGTRYTQTRPVGAPGVTAPPVQVVNNYYPAGQPAVSPKSRLVATLLGFFLGGLGVHRFYLGNVGLGIALLLVGWLTLGIWPLIDWIVVLAGNAHDGQGLPVRNWE